MVLFETNAARNTGLQRVAPVRLEEWNRMNASFTGIAGAETQNLTDTSGPLPEKLLCADVSRRFFSVLGVLPLVGREFTLEEERFGGPAAALISEQLWRKRFAASRDILGKTLRLNGALYPIVGVLPAAFRMPMTNEDVEVWTPSAFPPQ